MDHFDAARLTVNQPEHTLGVASPADELAALVSWGAALFYWAESEVNPGVRSYWDALHYIATSLSVGYANVFPMTPIGKSIGAVVMMVGPALAARALDAPGPATPNLPAPTIDIAPVVARLDAILAELRQARGSS
jgi:voltage-gated potassium channel